MVHTQTNMDVGNLRGFHEPTGTCPTWAKSFIYEPQVKKTFSKFVHPLSVDGWYICMHPTTWVHLHTWMWRKPCSGAKPEHISHLPPSESTFDSGISLQCECEWESLCKETNENLGRSRRMDTWPTKGHSTHQTDSPWPLHFKHSHWWKRRTRSKFATSHYAWGTNGVCECKMDVKSIWHSYMASNGSCLMVTWNIFKKLLLEVGPT